MILYLSFAPIEFKGGAEIWLGGIAERTAKYEKTYLITVSSTISDFYGRLVLNRKFSNHTHKIDIKKVTCISLLPQHFNPFSKEYEKVKSIFYNSRIIYAKFELAELFISIYFGGLKILEKIVGGIHSPLFYTLPQSFFNHLHNFVYTSAIYKFFLSRIKKVHVLNKRDQAFLKTKFGYQSTIQIYDGVTIPKTENLFSSSKNTNILNIITVGELSFRKGTDILCEVIKKSPDNFRFSIIGSGPLIDIVRPLTVKSNCKYLGYISDKKKLEKIYAVHDVLLFPSRAETLGLVMPEAMNYGLRVINYKDVALQMPNYVELTSNSEDSSEYIRLLNKVLIEKNNNAIQKNKIHKYAYENFSNDILHPKFFKEILNIHPNQQSK